MSSGLPVMAREVFRQIAQMLQVLINSALARSSAISNMTSCAMAGTKQT